MKKILIIAEHHNQQLSLATQQVATAALTLSDKYDVLLVGKDCGSMADALSQLKSVEEVFIADHAVYEHQLAENTASLIITLSQTYDYILTSATTFGKNLLPRVAALLDVMMVSDVIKIVNHDTFIRPIYAGNALATVQLEEKIKLLTIRPTAFQPTPFMNDPVGKKINVDTVIENKLTTFVKQSLTVSKRPELTAAKIIVAGGRGLKSAENFHLIEKIADKIGAAVGASRAAVDAGFAPNDYQVGQTGKVVAPDLYIAVGISGAIQHLAGMKDSKVIVAINSDPEAPIFQIADYGLVGDLFKILPELQSELEK